MPLFCREPIESMRRAHRDQQVYGARGFLCPVFRAVPVGRVHSIMEGLARYGAGNTTSTER